MMSTKNLHVIKASAGAGKTYTLAKVYIEHLLWDKSGKLRPLHSCYHQHILAITFTNKATAEMKERIIVRLYELSNGTCGAYQQYFQEAHPATSPEDLKAAAQAALEDILFDYTAFNISTIDSFFQTVLRNFVYELDREYDYDLQLDENFATLQAVQGLMQSIGDGRNSGMLGEWINNYVTEQVRSQSDWNFFGNKTASDLASFAKVLGNENFMKHHADIKAYLSDIGSGKKSALLAFRKALVDVKKAYEEKIGNFHEEVKNFIEGMGIGTDQLNKRYPVAKLMMVSDLQSLGSSVKTIATYAENIDKLKGAFKKGALTESQMGHELLTFQEMLKGFIGWKETVDVTKSIVSNLWQLGLLGKIDENLEQYRKDNNQIFISDTTDLIHKVVECDVPFIYERMGMWLNHFMIDEFQDTSRKQYENFKPLLENSLSGANYNLIIGDEKQSIYRFRNSDPNLFQNDLPTDFSSEYDDSEDLHINRRSTKLVIDFNNEFFKQILDYYAKNRVSFKKLQTTYGKLHQDYPAYSDEAKEAARIKGFVKLNLVYGTPTKSSGPLPYLKGSDGQPYYGKEGVLKHLPEYILEQHNKYNYPFGKILILVNRNKEGDEVVNAILEHNKAYPDRLINIVSAESLLLQNSAAVRMVISVLYFINSTQHAHSDEDEDIDTGKPTMQKLMQKRLKDQLYYKTLHDFGQALGKAGENADAGELMEKVFRNNDDLRQKPVEEQVEIFADQLKNLLPNPKNEQASLVGVVDKIIKEYLEPIGLNKGAETSFLLALQGVVLDFSTQRTNGGTIYEFLKYWEMKKDKLAISPGQNDDAVEVMTIHKAKGLERPCVIVPLADWDMEQMDRLCWLPKDNWLNPDGMDHPYLEVPPTAADSALVPPLIPIPGNTLAKMKQFESFSSPLLEDCVIDSLNKSYVAFTRPRQSLHIFAPVEKDLADDKPITKINEHLLTSFPNLEGCNTVKSDIPEAAGCVAYYCIGEEDCYEEQAPEEAQEVTQEMMPDYTVSPILDRLRVKLPELATKIQESGKRMHHIMSRIRTAEQVKKAISYAVKRGIITADDEQYWNLSRAEAFLDRLMTDEQTAHWFAKGNKVYNERSIYIPPTASDRAHHLRPDRIVRATDGSIYVIDYKFGDTPGEKQQATYKQQVQTYCRFLSDLWHAPVEGYLLYAKAFKVEKVV